MSFSFKKGKALDLDRRFAYLIETVKLKLASLLQLLIKVNRLSPALVINPILFLPPAKLTQLPPLTLAERY